MAKDLQRARKWLKESDFEMLMFSVASLTDSQEILRGIPTDGIPKEEMGLCKEFLITIGSDINKKASHTILNPSVGKEEWPGTWQHFFAGLQIFNRKEYLTQVIRLGFYQDVPYQDSEVAGDRTVQTRQQLGLTLETPEPVTGVAGQIKSQRVDVNREDKSKIVRTEKDTGTAQTNTTTSKTPDSTEVITEKTVQATALTASTPTDGTIRRIVNAASKYFNRYTTTEEVETGIAQTITNTIKSPSETIVIADKTVQSAAVTVPALQAGVLKRIRNVWSKYFNRWDTSEEMETGIAQTTTSKVETGMEKSTTEEKTVQASELAAPVAPILGNTDITKHAVESTVNKPSKYPERWDTRKKTDIPKAVSVPEFIARYGERSTDYISEEKHDVNAPDIDDETANGIETSVLAHSLDDFLTHNYKVMRSVRKFPFDTEVSWITWGGTETQTTQVWSAALGRYWNDHTYIYQIKTFHYLKYFDNDVDAAAYVNDSLGSWSSPWSINHVLETNGSGISQTGVKEWLGRKIRTYRILRDTYSYDEPLS